MITKHDSLPTDRGAPLLEVRPSAHPVTSGRDLSREKALRPPILLLSSGRCGSTLLQRVLNSSPEITIWGEHAGFLTSIAQSYFTLPTGEQSNQNFRNSPVPYQSLIGEYHDRGKSISWVNPFDAADIRTCFRRFLLQLFARDLDPSRVHWGFKEIRYSSQDRVFDMWKELFPDTRYVFLTRNPYRVIRSMMIAFHRDTVDAFDPREMESLAVNCAHRWSNANRAILEWSRQIPARSILIRYEELVEEKETSVKRLFQFLDLPTPPAAMAPLRFKVDQTKGSPPAPAVDNFLAQKKELLIPVIGETAEALAYRI